MKRAEVIRELKMRQKIAAGKTTSVSAEELENIIILLEEQRKVGKWVEPKDSHEYVSPGGTPSYECSLCGGSLHLHGVEYPKRKLFCDNCGAVNSYPWEKTYDDASSFS